MTWSFFDLSYSKFESIYSRVSLFFYEINFLIGFIVAEILPSQFLSLISLLGYAYISNSYFSFSAYFISYRFSSRYTRLQSSRYSIFYLISNTSDSFSDRIPMNKFIIIRVIIKVMVKKNTQSILNSLESVTLKSPNALKKTSWKFCDRVSVSVETSNRFL